jgi:hypothetical protein
MDNIKSIGKDLHIFLCVMAVIVSSVIFNILIRSGYTMDGFVIGRENYEIISNADFFELTFITLFTRFKQLAVIYVLYRLVNSELAYDGIIMMCSFIVGGMICIQTFYQGISGVIELVLFLFPHYIFYFLAVKTMYTQLKRCGKTGTRGLMVVLLLFLSGVLCELFFSKIFLREFYQYVVLK